MSNEEKKAIEYIKEFKNEVFEGVGNKSIMAKNIDILLDVIEKQQKEIEKLNFENHMIKKWNERLDKNCISKDKIREKIEEITSYAYTSVEERECQTYARQVLKDLLEEN